MSGVAMWRGREHHVGALSLKDHGDELYCTPEIFLGCNLFFCDYMVCK